MKSLPPWKMKALADPNLSDKEWTLLKLGPSSLAEAFRLQAMKIRYSFTDK